MADRSDDLIATVNGLVADVAQLQRLVASRLGGSQHFLQSVVFTASVGTVTFPVAFPTSCDGAVWVFDGSVGAGSISPTGCNTRTTSTIGVVCGGAFTGSLQIAMWAWGH